MDRERDRDTAESLIEEHDEKTGTGKPERARPGEHDDSARPVDSQKPDPESPRPRPDHTPDLSNPNPFTPH